MNVHTCSEAFDLTPIGPSGGPYIEFRHYQNKAYKRSDEGEWIESSKGEYMSTIAEMPCKACLADCPNGIIDLLYYFFVMDRKNVIATEECPIS